MLRALWLNVCLFNDVHADGGACVADGGVVFGAGESLSSERVCQ